MYTSILFAGPHGGRVEAAGIADTVLAQHHFAVGSVEHSLALRVCIETQSVRVGVVKAPVDGIASVNGDFLCSGDTKERRSGLARLH